MIEINGILDYIIRCMLIMKMFYSSVVNLGVYSDGKNFNC